MMKKEIEKNNIPEEYMKQVRLALLECAGKVIRLNKNEVVFLEADDDE